MEALHESQRRAGVSPAPVGNADGTEPLALARSLGRRDACPTLGPAQFMVPVHAQKRKHALRVSRFWITPRHRPGDEFAHLSAAGILEWLHLDPFDV